MTHEPKVKKQKRKVIRERREKELAACIWMFVISKTSHQNLHPVVELQKNNLIAKPC